MSRTNFELKQEIAAFYRVNQSIVAMRLKLKEAEELSKRHAEARIELNNSYIGVLWREVRLNNLVHFCNTGRYPV